MKKGSPERIVCLNHHFYPLRKRSIDCLKKCLESITSTNEEESTSRRAKEQPEEGNPRILSRHLTIDSTSQTDDVDRVVGHKEDLE